MTRFLRSLALSAALVTPALSACVSSASHESDGIQDMRVEVVALEYADADEVAALIRDLYGDSAKLGEPGQRFELRVDARTNSLILRAYPQRLDELVSMLEKLDIPATGKDSR